MPWPRSSMPLLCHSASCSSAPRLRRTEHCIAAAHRCPAALFPCHAHLCPSVAVPSPCPSLLCSRSASPSQCLSVPSLAPTLLRATTASLRRAMLRRHRANLLAAQAFRVPALPHKSTADHVNALARRIRATTHLCLTVALHVNAFASTTLNLAITLLIRAIAPLLNAEAMQCIANAQHRITITQPYYRR